MTCIPQTINDPDRDQVTAKKLKRGIALRSIHEPSPFQVYGVFHGGVAADHVLLESANGADDPLMELRDRFLEDEFVHLLIGTAVTNRIQDEYRHGIRSASDGSANNRHLRECGSLWPDALKDTEPVLLGFCEACNKIVHALQIVPETAGDPANHPISNLVILRGQLRDAAWVAHLDILEYVRGSVRNFAALP